MVEFRRRRVLRSMAAGAGILGGCLGPTAGGDGCGAAGPRMNDDVLRVTVDDVHREGEEFLFQGRVAQPGREGWSHERDRSRFTTEYDGVRIHAFALDGTELLAEPLGAFEAGTVESFSARTGAFPDVITASVSAATGEYSEGCMEGVRGAEVRGYAGYHGDERPEETYEPYRDRTATWADRRLGHVWGPVGTLLPDDSLPPSRRAFRWTLCQQRRIAGPREDTDRLEILPDAARRVRRRETYRLRVYRYLRQATRRDRRVEAAGVPGPVLELRNDTDWEAMDDGGATTYEVERRISRSEFERFYAELEGRSSPTMVGHGCYDTPGHVLCSNHWPGHCREGGITAVYRFHAEGGPSALDLVYEWTGPQYPDRLGGSPEE